MKPEEYNGSWERNGRSVTAAAIIGLIGIGVVYFYLQSILTAVAVIVANGLGLGNSKHGSETLSDGFIETLRVVVFATQYLFMLLPSWYLIRRLHSRNVRTYIRLQNFSFYQTLLAVIGTVSLIPLSLLFSTFLSESLGIPRNYSDESAAFFTSYTPAEFLWLIAGIAITPAVCEEVFFRGHVQRTLERSLSIHSIWIVGIVFGLFHFQPLGLASLSLLGLYFGYIFYRSKSLYPSMFAHFTNNAIALLFAYQPFVNSSPWLDTLNSEGLAVWNLGALPVAAVTIVLFHRSTSPPKNVFGEWENEHEKASSTLSVESNAERWVVNGIGREHEQPVSPDSVHNRIRPEGIQKRNTYASRTARRATFRRH